jgi:site-specific DNA recombinase
MKSRLGEITYEVPALVPETVWKQANEQVQKNRRTPKGNQTRTYLLRGLIRCGLCGSTFVGSKASDGQGWFKYYYRCNRQLRSDTPNCPASVISAEKIESYIWDKCQTFIENPGEVVHLLQQKIAAYSDQTKDTVEQQRLLQEALLEKGKARDRIKYLFIHGHITPKEMENEYKTIDRDITTIRAELDALRSTANIADAYSEYYENITTLLTSLRAKVKNVDEEAKAYLISRLLADIRVDTEQISPRKKRVELTCRFHFQTDHVALDDMPSPIVVAYRA